MGGTHESPPSSSKPPHPGSTQRVPRVTSGRDGFGVGGGGGRGAHLRNSCRQVSQKRCPQVETRTGSRMGFPHSGHSTLRRGRSSSL